MKSSKGIIGAILTVLIILALVATNYWVGTRDERAAADLETVTCLVGGEKMDFLSDPQITEILADNGLKLDALRRGSIEMVTNPQDLSDDVDCVWPSNQVAFAMYRNDGGQYTKSENVFYSPIVIYSWAPITDALIAEGIVTIEPNPAIADATCDPAAAPDQQTGCVYYLDFEKLVLLIEEETRWSDIGLTQLFGPIKIHSTNPTRSNSGNMYSALLANTLAEGDIATEASIQQQLPRINRFFEQQGYMSDSSGNIFEQYIEQGMGTYPLMVGYESQIVEFSLSNRDNQNLSNRVNREVRVLYPRPTVWAQHPLIARSENGDKLLEILLTPEVQKIAWEQHGFRSNSAGSEGTFDNLPIGSQIPPDILSVVDMPSVGTMERLLDGLANPSQIPAESTPATRRESDGIDGA